MTFAKEFTAFVAGLQQKRVLESITPEQCKALQAERGTLKMQALVDIEGLTLAELVEHVKITARIRAIEKTLYKAGLQFNHS